MATTKVLGKVSLTLGGDYRDAVSYSRLTMVLAADGKGYVSKQDNTVGIEPAVTAGWENYWQLVAERGAGVTSIQKTASGETSDTYTIYYENGTTSTYQAENGKGYVADVTRSLGDDFSIMTGAYSVIDGAGWTNGKYLKNNGDISNVADMKVMALTAVPEGSYTLAIRATSPFASQTMRFCGYNGSGTFVRTIGSFAAPTSAGVLKATINTTGCAQIRIAAGLYDAVAVYANDSIDERVTVIEKEINTLFTQNGVTWEQGSINYTTGANLNSSTRVRTPGYADLSTAVVVSDTHEIAAYVYNRAGTFIGVWNGSAFLSGTTTWMNVISFAEIYAAAASTAPDCLIRIIARNPDDSNLAPSGVTGIRFLANTEDKLYATVSLYQTWAVCGASFDSGYYSGANHYAESWPQILARRSGTTASNYTFGGATVKSWIERTDGRGLAKALEDAAREMYVMTFGGNDANHFNEVPLGSIDDITDYGDWHDYPATFYGYYGQIIEQIAAHAPNAKLIMTTPSSPWYNANQVLVDNAIREIAAHYTIPLIIWESDSFMRSNLFINNQVSDHPTPILYSGMALAFERLFSKAVLEYSSYFNALPT